MRRGAAVSLSPLSPLIRHEMTNHWNPIPTTLEILADYLELVPYASFHTSFVPEIRFS
jgi:hypothetical protein